MHNRKTDGISFIKIISRPRRLRCLPVDMQPLRFTFGDYSVPPSLLITTFFCFQKACGMCSIWICLLIRMGWAHLLSTNVHPAPLPMLLGASLSSELKERKKRG